MAIIWSFGISAIPISLNDILAPTGHREQECSATFGFKLPSMREKRERAVPEVTTCYSFILAPASSATAPSVVCAAFSPSRKSLSLKLA